MAGDLTLKLKLIADEKAAVQALKSAQRETKLLANTATSASKRARAMGKAYKYSGDQGFAAMVKMQRGMAGLKTQMLALVAGGGALQFGGNILDQADAYKKLESRIRLVTDSEEEMKAVQGLLMQQAQENRTEIAAVTGLYAGVTPVLKEMGRSQEDILSITDAVSKSLQIGGASASETSSSITQLSQAFASGVLRGDEFNSLMENAPALMRSVADSMDLPVGSLRALAQEGKLTSELLANSIISQGDAITASFDDIDVTVGAAMVTVKNSIGQYIGETDKALGFTSALSAGLQTLAGDLSIAGSAAAAMGSVGIGRMLAASAQSENGMIRRMKLRRAEALVATQAAATEAAAEQALQVAKANTAKMELQSALRKKIATAQALTKAKANFAEAKASQAAALATSGTAASSQVAAKATDVYTASLARLKVAQMASTAAAGSLVTARKASSVASIAAANSTASAAASYGVAGRAIAAVSGKAAFAAKGLSAALMFVGGPVGAALLAATAIYTYRAELIDLINGTSDAEQATIDHEEAMDLAKKQAYEYAAGSEVLRKQIKKEGETSRQTTEDQLNLAEARLAAAKAANEAAGKSKSEVDKSAEGKNPREFAQVREAAGLRLQSTSSELQQAQALFDVHQKNIDQIRKRNSYIGQTKEQLDATFAAEEAASNKIQDAGKLKSVQDQQKEYGKSLRAYLDGKSGKSKAAKSELSELEQLKKAQDDEMASLVATHDQLLLNNQAYYAQSLALKKFAPDVIEAAKGLKYQNTLLQEQQALQAERIGSSQKITAQYEVDLSKKGLNPDDIKSLADQKIKISFETGYLDLRDQQAQLALTDEGYRRATLAAQGYDEIQVEALVNQGNMNNRLEAQYELLNESAALRPKLTAQYEIELENKGVDKRAIEKFSNEKIRLSFEALKQGLAETAGQLDVGAVAYRKASLEAKGYTDQQIKVVQGLEASNKAREAIRSVEESFKGDRAALSSKLTVDLELELNEAGVDQATIDRLANDKIGIAFDDLKQGLQKTNQELLVGEKAYRAIDLAAQGFDETQVKTIQRLEATGRATKAIKSVQDSLASGERSASQKITVQLEYDLKEAGVDQATIDKLSGAKIQQSFEGLKKGLNDASKELAIGEKAYRAIDLAAQGFDETQVKTIQGLEGIARAASAVKSVETALASGDRAFSKKITVDLEFDLKDAGVDQQTIDRLAGEKIQQSFKGLSASLDESSQKLSLGAVAYRGIELAALGYSAAQSKVIQNKEFKNVFNAEIAQLEKANDQLELNARQQYAAGLAAKGFTGETLKQATSLEYSNALLAQRNQLEASRAQIGASKATTYQAEYQDKGFSADDSKSLATDKISQDFDKMKRSLQDNRNEILMTADAYRELGLTMENGFSTKQAGVIVGLENQNKAFAKWKDFSNKSLDSVGNSLNELVKTGETDWKGLIANMISEAFKLAVIQPMIESLKNSFSGGGGGGGLGGLLGSFLPFAQGGAFAGAGGPQLYAQGGAFTNQIVSQPTAFVGAGKLSVMGEAGPEVIMPLTRTSTGNMGVEVDLTGTPPVSINMAPQITVQSAPAVLMESKTESSITDSTPDAAPLQAPPMVVNLYEDASKAGSVEQSTDDQGRQTTNLFVADIRGGGKSARALESTYGLKRKGTF